jgi:hypothetical protein
MIIDKSTISILKNFSTINTSILIKKGNTLTSGIPKNIIAKATLDISFPRRFALANLPKLINILEMFKEPSVEFLDNMLMVSSNGRNFKLMYTEEKIIEDEIVQDGTIELPSVYALTEISNEVLSQLMKALRILGYSEIHFYGDGEELFVGISDSENPSSDSYSVFLGKSDKKFRAIFKSEYFNLYPDNYEVAIYEKGLAVFTSEKLQYIIAMNKNNSDFE